MLRENIDRGWEFVNGKPSNIPGFGKQARVVNLPHDFMIEMDTSSDAPGGTGTGFYNGGIGTYTKMLDIPESMIGKRVVVEFDGCYMNASVVLNGHTVGHHHYGYTPFHIDLTEYVKVGKNRLAVTANNGAQPNARWYSGSGIYRHVDLLTSSQIHLATWGIYAHTSHIVNDTAFVIVETTVENHSGHVADLWVDIKIQKEDDDGQTSIGRVRVHVLPNSKEFGRVTVAVENASLWDIDSPNLYTITAELTDKETIFDSETTTFGIRTISIDTKNGFMLNGRTLKLKGGCVHHDNGILGAASFRDSEYRRMKAHKDNGYNAIRFAHNPMSRDLLDACDQLGLLVINEAFDVWTMEKNTHDYSQYFEEDWKADMEAFILRDRNHPSIIMWSTGNEVGERGGLSKGYEWAAKLAAFVRELDPTRFVTNALCSFFSGLDDEDNAKFFAGLMQEMQKPGANVLNLDSQFGRGIWGAYTEAFSAPLDVVGYNYLNYHYESALKEFPNRVICCTESKPKEMVQYWSDADRFPHVIGDFNWTSHDYIGEAGIGKQLYVKAEEAQSAFMNLHNTQFPWRLAYGADFDLCSFPRPQLAFRRIVWGSDETYITCLNPKHAGKTEVLGRYGWADCENSWSWLGYEGTEMKVDVYSAADEVELILNGKRVGKKNAGKENQYTAQFELPFEVGTLEAISYTAGKKISSNLLKSAGKISGIKITPDKTELAADGQSLSFVVVEVVDAEGNIIPDAEIKATAKVDGVAILAAFGNGRPQSEENYTRGEFTSFKGKLLAIVRSGYEVGTSVLTVTLEGLKAASIEIKTK